MNIFMREMRAHLKSLIIWCINVILIIAMGMMKYAAFSKTGESVEKMMAAMPQVFKTMFGVGFFNLTEVRGYYGVFFLYFVLMATIHAAMLGATIISKEERDKTAEFLFVKPAGRKKIIISKVLAVIANIFIFNMTTLVSSIIIVGSYNKGESINKDIVLLMMAMFILQLIFMSIGTATASISKNPKKSASVSMAVLLGTYILSIAVDMNSKLENLKYFTPFKYFEAKNLMLNGKFETTFVVLSIIIIGVLSSATYIFYRKRDLKV
ncbi:ABC transporter permease subunit [Clostridium sp. ZS2-4]|uniref:ABC transporter permease subunit n=1 Tax=Clostridium sp. ZS2-4 TaxID=2987703 RepID=UPI00227A4B8A|nr:ABC transporter permease subunit [Clostridium sp. ZS2-4]MCY6355317.1 ABC transporter permease subunit [Clostridium sp. ZS2-4]